MTTETHITEADGQNFVTLRLQEAVLLHNLAACLDVCMPLVELCAKNERRLNKNVKSPIKQTSWQIRQKEFLEIIAQAAAVLKADGREIYFNVASPKQDIPE